jgi:rubredoxin
LEHNLESYICTNCGFVYEAEYGDTENGIPAGTPFEQLPADWDCPVCDADKERFDPL